MRLIATSHPRIRPSSVPYRGPEWHRACATDYREMASFWVWFLREHSDSSFKVAHSLNRIARWRDGFREHMRDARRLEREALPL